MSDPAVNPLDDPDTDAARAYAEERRESIRTFVRTNPDYYIRNFDKIGEVLALYRHAQHHGRAVWAGLVWRARALVLGFAVPDH